MEARPGPGDRAGGRASRRACEVTSERTGGAVAPSTRLGGPLPAFSGYNGDINTAPPSQRRTEEAPVESVVLQQAGVWALMIKMILALLDQAGALTWTVSVDSTTVRAHQAAAGIRAHRPGPTAATWAYALSLTCGESLHLEIAGLDRSPSGR